MARPNVHAWFERKVNELTNELKEGLKEVASEGADEIRHYISTRGISKPGRIDTGAMLESVNWNVVSESNDEITVAFGFQPGPYYTKYQEFGTKRIAPMYALTDAADDVETKIDGLLKRVSK